MGIHTMMSNAIKTEWQLTDDYQLSFFNPTYPLEIDGLRPQDIIDIALVNVDTPQLDAAVSSHLTGGSYRITNGVFGVFTTTLTFRDVKGLGLKNYFSKIWMAQQDSYFDEIKSSINISIGQRVLFKSDECLISSISQSQFSSSGTAISEFSVEFTSPTISNGDINRFGAPGNTGRQ